MSPPQTQVAFQKSPDYVQALHRGLDVICAFSREGARIGRLFSLSPRILELGLGYMSTLGVARLALPCMQELLSRSTSPVP